MHPNSVTVLMYFATKTEVDHKLKQRNQTNRFACVKYKGSDEEEESQKVMCYIRPHDFANISVQFFSNLHLTVPFPFFICSSPAQLLTRSPCPGPEELPNTTCPSREAFCGISSGWNCAPSGFLQHVRFL